MSVRQFSGIRIRPLGGTPSAKSGCRRCYETWRLSFYYSYEPLPFAAFLAALCFLCLSFCSERMAAQYAA